MEIILLIIFDADDTMLAYEPAFIDYWSKQGKSPIKTIHEMTIEEYSFENMYGESRSVITKMIEEFNTSDEFGRLRSFLTADQMDELEVLRKDHTIVCITACGKNRITQLLRNNNILLELPFELDDVVFLPLGSDKNEAIWDTIASWPQYEGEAVLFFDNCRKTIRRAKTIESYHLTFKAHLVDHYRPEATALTNFTQILEVIKSF